MFNTCFCELWAVVVKLNSTVLGVKNCQETSYYLILDLNYHLVVLYYRIDIVMARSKDFSPPSYGFQMLL